MRKKVVLIVLALCIIFSLCACGGTTNKENSYTETCKVAQYAEISAEGDAIFPDHTGNIQKISGDSYSAVRTKDGSHIYLLENDGILSYIVDGTKTKVSGTNKPVRSISKAANDGLIYSFLENKGKYYVPNDYSYESYKDNKFSYELYRFSVGTVTLGEIDSYKTAQESTAILYTVQDEDTEKTSLYLLKPNDTEPNAIVSNTTSKLLPVGISDDGSIYAWLEDDTIYLFADGERQKAFSDVEDTSFYTYFNEAGDLAVITCYDCDTIAFWTKENGIVKVRMPDGVSGNVYTDAGNISVYRNVSPDALYFSTETDGSLYNFYSVTMDGNREKIASGIKTLNFINDRFYYTNDDDQLVKMSLKSGEVQSEEKIADGVNGFSVSPDGKSVVYVRDVANDMVGSIYYFSEGFEKPIRLVAEGFCEYYHWSYSGTTSYYFEATFSNDGKSIFYFTDGSEIKDSGEYSATLMQYDIASGESKRIGTDILHEINSEYLGGYPVGNGLWYQKYASFNEEEDKIYTDLLFWDGENTNVLANDIIY